MAYRVFISYSSKDLPVVHYVTKLLATVPGVEWFVAEYSVAPGQPLASDIIEAIKACNLFLLLWSRNSGQSEWVPQEIGVARGHNKHIVPVVLEPGLKPPGFIAGLKYLPAYADSGWPAALQQLVTAGAQKQQQTQALLVLLGGGLALWALSQK